MPGTFGKAHRIRERGVPFQPEIRLGPGGGLLEVGKRPVPEAKADVALRSAEISLSQLGIALKGGGPFVDRGLVPAHTIRASAL